MKETRRFKKNDVLLNSLKPTETDTVAGRQTTLTRPGGAKPRKLKALGSFHDQVDLPRRCTGVKHLKFMIYRNLIYIDIL